MKPALFLSVLGGLTSETRTLVDAMTVKPTSTRMRRIDRVIRGLKQSGVWDKLDVFYMLAAHDEQAGRLNWKSPGTFTATATNSPAFVANRGVTSDGTSSYLDTGFNPTTGTTVGYAQDNAHQGVWCLTNVDSAAAACGNSNARIIPRSGTIAGLAGHSVTANYTLPANTSVGHVMWSRDNAVNFAAYKDGGSAATLSVASAAPTSATLWICGRNGAASFNTSQICSFHAGTSLTAVQVAALYAAKLAYMQGIGAA